MFKLVLLRHGESSWNKENRFTGWIDVSLTAEGKRQAKGAGKALQQAGFSFDVAYTSVLKRAVSTLELLQEAMDLPYLPVVQTWRLNDRHYGALSGMDREEAARRYGTEQVLRWRRGFDDAPPPSVAPSDNKQLLACGHRFAMPKSDRAPLTESLRDTWIRMLPIWHEAIAPAILSNRRVLVVAHGNSLRALIKHLYHIPDDAISQLEIPNGEPLVYTLDAQLRPVERTCVIKSATKFDPFFIGA